jgi:transposase-like protein
MRYPASEKAEIIRLVEQSHLPAKRTLDKLGIPRATFYRWYDRYRDGGPEALADHRSRPDRVWNRIPDGVRRQIIDLALELPELSPRELAVRFTDENKYFVSEASVYRLLKPHDLITSPAYVVIKAANEFYKRMLGFQGPAQPSPALGDALNAGYRYLEVKCLGCNTHQTVALDIVRRPKAAPVHELERYMRCKDCSQVRGYAYKRSHLVTLRTTKITADDPPSTWWPGER